MVEASKMMVKANRSILLEVCPALSPIPPLRDGVFHLKSNKIKHNVQNDENTYGSHFKSHKDYRESLELNEVVEHLTIGFASSFHKEGSSHRLKEISPKRQFLVEITFLEHLRF
jgi:hypothetical protein